MFGRVFEHVLANCGVFAWTPEGDAAFRRYVRDLQAALHGRTDRITAPLTRKTDEGSILIACSWR